MEEAIRRAEEAGWRFRDKYNFVIFNNIDYAEGRWMFKTEGGDNWELATWQELVLDLLLWQALAKAEGWPELVCEHCGYPVPERNVCADANCPLNGWEVKYHGWLWQQHQLLDHLAKGGNAGEFFNSLLKK